MKNSQKGFIVPVLLAIIVLLLVGGGTYVYTQQKQENQSTNTDQSIQATQSAKPTSPVQTALFTASPISGSAPLDVMFNYGVAYGTGTIQFWVDFGDGQPPQDLAYGCELDTKIPCKKGWNHNHIYTSAGAYTATLYSTNVNNKNNLGTITITVGQTTCTRGRLANPPIDLPPVITSLSRAFGPIGSILEIRGCNLSSFEGDLEVTFESSDGKKIILTDKFGSYSKTEDTLIKVVVKEPCAQGETVYGTYSGLPSICNYTPLMPGTYKVYTTPWGKKSNEMTFTITSQ